MISFIPEEIQAYADAFSAPESELLNELARETRATQTDSQMMVGHSEGLLLSLLVRLSGARRVLEIGTFTGYSTLSMASGLPDDGELITCDIDETATTLARRYWDRSPHGRKIQLRLAPALDTIATLHDPIDLVFIDADKPNYVHYWEAVLPLVRAGGAIVADNVLWSGRVLHPKERDDHAIVAFNEHVRHDARVRHVMLPIRDGITVAVKNWKGSPMGSIFKAFFVALIVLAITGGIGLAIMAGVAGTHEVKPIAIPGDCSIAVLAEQWDYADAFRRPMEYGAYRDIHQVIENAPLKGDGEIHRTAKEVVYAGSWPGVNYQIAYILDRETHPYSVKLVTAYRFKGSKSKHLLKVYKPIHRCLAPFLLDRLGSRAPS